MTQVMVALEQALTQSRLRAAGRDHVDVQRTQRGQRTAQQAIIVVDLRRSAVAPQQFSFWPSVAPRTG
jgi:hypothetical protein